ncbi:MAG: GNAT family N-acetyltransferase [Ornithinimicrobium sp.]|uniref:GNAT family N-acetyltransferase n=1 Tax=Ornithinimicrobium sp. TaxID=1977084 RepID=UPI0026DFEC83|nr:GNAT family N-acetyltransferase [Ornithinimicrobium sp.]MDO5738806.1 GNAT family N-acetyltransferase [Ornithinimicrobium sp.]
MTSSHQEPTGFNVLERVRRTVRTSAARAGVELVVVEEVEQLREISALFAAVWGRSSEGVPMHSEAMRSMVHAGGMVNAAHDTTTGELLGAAVLGRDEPGACYGYLAAAAPNAGDRGIGRTLKQHQRFWALEHGLDVMRWTFDPLVARNARFNISRLGAVVRAYEVAFYGHMADDLNGTDVGDRVVAQWDLRSSRALAAGEGVLPEHEIDPVRSAPAGAHVEDGPDGTPALVVAGVDRWLRVPPDIVALRGHHPEQARAWRASSANWMQEAFAAGLSVHAVSRTGWYHLQGETA